MVRRREPDSIYAAGFGPSSPDPTPPVTPPTPTSAGAAGGGGGACCRKCARRELRKRLVNAMGTAALSALVWKVIT